MAYRTLLVHADLSPQAPSRIRIAAALAKRFEAHLIGAALTGIGRFLLPASLEISASAIAEQAALVERDARNALAQFADIASSAGLRSLEQRCINTDGGGSLALAARYADLAIVSQTDPDQLLPLYNGALPEDLLFNSGKPVLVLPAAGWDAPVGANAMVAWDGSLEATHAVGAALPLLAQAGRVTVVVFAPDDRPGVHGDLPGADIALYLSRHGVKVDARVQPGAIDASSADLLVMGGYGHSRFREMMLGGVTRTILRALTLPVLLAH